MKRRLLTYCLPVVAAAAVSFTAASKPSMQLCKNTYALCTSAPCVPMPGDPTRSICYCDVEEGPSMGTLPCDQLRPSTSAEGVRTLYSTYSWKQYLQGKKAMRCPGGTPWSDCLNKVCTVDPADQKKAVCVCDVSRTGEWMTLGGDCNTATCENGYWSGASIEANAAANAFMQRSLDIEESPVKWCPASS